MAQRISAWNEHSLHSGCKGRIIYPRDRAWPLHHWRFGRVERRDWTFLQGGELGLSRTHEIHAHGHVQSDHQFSGEIFAAARGLPHGGWPRDARAVRQRRDAVCLDSATYHQLDGIRWVVAEAQRPGASTRPLRRPDHIFGGDYRKGRGDRRSEAEDPGASAGRFGNDRWRSRGCLAKEVSSSLFCLSAAIARAYCAGKLMSNGAEYASLYGLRAARLAKVASKLNATGLDWSFPFPDLGSDETGEIL